MKENKLVHLPVCFPSDFSLCRCLGGNIYWLIFEGACGKALSPEIPRMALGTNLVHCIYDSFTGGFDPMFEELQRLEMLAVLGYILVFPGNLLMQLNLAKSKSSIP